VVRFKQRHVGRNHEAFGRRTSCDTLKPVFPDVLYWIEAHVSQLHLVPPKRRSRTSQYGRNSALPARLATLTGSTTVAATRNTRTTLRFWPCFVDVKRTPTNVGTVQGGDGFVGLAVSHLHESEPSRAARIPIRH
jgi:hypothetical protein